MLELYNAITSASIKNSFRKFCHISFQSSLLCATSENELYSEAIEEES